MKNHLLQAADRGDTEAQFNLGIMYENRLDVSNREVARFAQGWKLKSPTVAAMSGQPEMPEGGRA